MSSRVVVAGKSSLADALSPAELTQSVHQLRTHALQVNKEHVEHFLECAICRGVMREPVMIKQLIELVYTDVDGYEAQQSSKLEQVAHASRANAVAIRDAAQHSGGRRRGAASAADQELEQATRRMQQDAAAVAAASSAAAETETEAAAKTAPQQPADSPTVTPSQTTLAAPAVVVALSGEAALPAAAPPTAPGSPSRGGSKRPRTEQPDATASQPSSAAAAAQGDAAEAKPSAAKRPRPTEAPPSAAQPPSPQQTPVEEMITFKVGRTPEPFTLGPFFSSAIGGTHYKFLQLPASTPLSRVAAQLGTWYPQYKAELQTLLKHGWEAGLALLLRGRVDNKTPDIPGQLLQSKQYPERCYRLLHPLGPEHKVLTLGDISAHARKLSVKDGQQKAGGGMFAAGQAGKTTAVPVLRLLWHYSRTHAHSGVVDVAAARACRHNLLLHGKHSSAMCGCGVEEPAFAKPGTQAAQG